MTDRTLRRLRRALDRIDDAMLNTPGVEFSRVNTGNWALDRLYAMDRAVFSFVRSGPKKLPMARRTGRPFTDLCNRLEYNFRKWMYNALTRYFYDDRSVMTRHGRRVRSKSEAMVADMLDDYGLTVRYEDPITLGGFKLHPDFYLPQVGCYVEYWGMAGDDEYNEIMKVKRRRYKNHGIKVIDLFPSDKDDLAGNFARKYKKCVGKELESL